MLPKRRAVVIRQKVDGLGKKWTVLCPIGTVPTLECAVVGSIIRRIGVILVAGNPLIWACWRIRSSLDAR